MNTGAVVVLLVVWLVVMLIGREIVCWYFKLNALLSTLERIEQQVAAQVLWLKAATETLQARLNPPSQ